MSKVQLINKSDIPKEPAYNASDEALSPVNSCPLNEEEEPVQKIIKAYFTNLENEQLEKITIEKEVYFVVETENMGGEELIIPFPNHDGEFKYEDEIITLDKVLKLQVADDTEKIKLGAVAKRKDTPTEEQDAVPASTPLPPTEEDASIVSVEFLDGTDDKILSSGAEQYVNLPYEDKWVDGTIVKNKDRLSRKPRIKVEFDQPGSHSFKIKLVPGDDNASYSDAEKGRNSNFKYEEKEKSYTTDEDGTKIIDDLFIAVAGNDTYTLSATDSNDKTVKSSSTITTNRFFYYMEIKMKGLTTTAKSLNTLEGEYQRNFMKLKSLPGVKMKFMGNISTGDQANFWSEVAKAYNTSKDGVEKKKHGLGIAYTGHLAVKNTGEFEEETKSGSGVSAVIIEIKAEGLRDGDGEDWRPLWKDIVKGEDWFVSCYYTLKGKSKQIDIPKNKCTLLPLEGDTNAFAFYGVGIKVRHLPKGEGTLTLNVNWVDRFRAGLAPPFGNYVCVCTKAWWQDISTIEQNQVIIHEFGHKVGMVADGTGKLPDKVETHYVDKGHVGPHCHNGNAATLKNYGTDEALGKSKCVMFGSTNGKTQFCGKCTPTVRKLDISSGW